MLCDRGIDLRSGRYGKYLAFELFGIDGYPFRSADGHLFDFLELGGRSALRLDRDHVARLDLHGRNVCRE